MGPLSRLPWSVRVIAFVLVLVAWGVAFGFDWPFWVGALTGAWIGVDQWRNERSARSTGEAAPH